jgi:uncharacterized protein YqhQ
MRILGGASKKDRISYVTKENCITAIRKEDGTIEFSDAKIDTGIAAYLMILKISILLSVMKEIFRTSMFWYVFSFVIYILLLLLGILVVRSKKSFLLNHGAEHAVFAAYKKLKRIPTIQEAACFPRISRFCGITIFGAFITCHIISFLVFAVFNYHISEILILFMALYLRTLPPIYLLGLFVQRFTTLKPGYDNLELAIAALSELERKQKIIEEKEERESEEYKNNVNSFKDFKMYLKKVIDREFEK